MGRDSEAARAIRQAFANHDLPAQQIRRQVLLYLDNTLFYHDRDPYRLLGLTPDCSLSDIRLRHKQMLQIFHPDRHPDEEAWFTDRSEQLNRAYAYLKANHGKPGSASMPYASTVAGSPPPGPTPAAPRQRRRPPPPVFPTKEALRRRLNHWLGNPASLQKRVYIALFVVPVLALLLLYLSSESGVKPSTSAVVADAASEAGELDTEQSPPVQQYAPHPTQQPPANIHGTETTETDTDAATATQKGGETEDEVAPSQQEPTQWTSHPLESVLDPLDSLLERPTPITAAPTTVPEKADPATEPKHPAIPDQVKADSIVESVPIEHNQQTDPEARPETGTQSRTEGASTEDNPAQPHAPDTEPRNTNHQSRATANESPITNHQSRSPVTAVKALLAKYQAAYNQSDIDRFSSLFEEHARTKNAANRSEIREKYDALFRKTRKRNLVLDDIRVRIVGERQYEVKTSYKVDLTYTDGKASSSTGRFNIHVVTVNGELKIWRLDD